MELVTVRHHRTAARIRFPWRLVDRAGTVVCPLRAAGYTIEPM